jgi:hypothetical protein
MELSNGQNILEMSLEDMKAEMLERFKLHPAKGLFLRLCEVGLAIREINFIEAKKGRTGYENTLKTLMALRKLPDPEARLKRLKLQKR